MALTVTIPPQRYRFPVFPDQLFPMSEDRELNLAASIVYGGIMSLLHNAPSTLSERRIAQIARDCATAVIDTDRQSPRKRRRSKQH